jgi:TonB family protein
MVRTLAALTVLFCGLPLLSAQAVPQRVRVTESAMRSFVVHKVPPEYPPQAREAHIQGTVNLQIWVSKTGDIEDLKLVSGHPLLAPAAIEAVKQWKYKPYLLNGTPVIVETTVSVNFTLAEEPAPGQTSGIAPSTDSKASAATVPGPLRVSAGIESGLIVKKVAPVYPQMAKDARIQGDVILKAVIDREGNVVSLEPVSGPPELAPPAIEAVKKWKYKPYLRNGMPMEVETQIKVAFTLLP